jgi:Uma2 family endonuclease
MTHSYFSTPTNEVDYMALTDKKEREWISVEEYLQGERVSDVKHEYIDGHVYAMSGASKNHERISGNVYRQLGNHLEGNPCEPFASDIKIKVGQAFFYPDVTVVCEDTAVDEYYVENPVIIVEVLSKSTRRMDETTKKLAYQAIPALKEYVLIEQDVVDVEGCRRREGWVSRHYFMGDEVTFEAVGLTLPVEAIYHRVENDDVRTFLAEQSQQA